MSASTTAGADAAQQDTLAEIISSMARATVLLRSTLGANAQVPDFAAMVESAVAASAVTPPKRPRVRRSGADLVSIAPHRLREARAVLNMRQRSVMAATGIRTEVISQIEKGRNVQIDRESAERLAKLLGVTLAHLTGEGDLIGGADLSLGDRLRIARKRANWSRKKLATELGVTVIRVHDWEMGSPELAEQDLGHIAKLLGVPASYLGKDRKEAQAA